MDDNEARKKRSQTAMERAALVLLLDRAGGSFAFTEAEYQAVGARFGGMHDLSIHEEVVRGEGPPVVRLTLARKAPKQGELPV